MNLKKDDREKNGRERGLFSPSYQGEGEQLQVRFAMDR